MTMTGASAAQRLGEYADLARWAPSKHNTQPWQFVCHPGWLDFWTDPRRELAATDPQGRERLVSLGAAVEVACVAARAQGRLPRVELFPEGSAGPVARLTEAGTAAVTPADAALVTAVRARRTDRGPLDATHLSAGLPFLLQDRAESRGAVLRLVSTVGDRASLSRLVERADRQQAVAGAVQHELDLWLRTDPRARDGVPVRSTRGPRASYAAQFVQRDFSSPGSLPDQDRPGRDAPLLAVLCTAHDLPQDWLAAGRALAAVLLRAAVDGAQASYLDQPVEVPALRAELQQQLSLPGPPQLVLRLGRGWHVDVPPRRADVVTSVQT